MITLKTIANSEGHNYTLEQLIEVAREAGISTDPDSEIDADELSTLRAYIIQHLQNQQEEKSEQARKEAISIKNMEKLINENYVFVDISSLLVPAADKAFRLMAPILKNASKKINISLSVVKTLYKYAQDVTNMERLEIALNGGNCAQDMVSMCSHFRLQAPLLVITQDQDLAADLLKLNAQLSASGFTIAVKKINKYGYLSKIDKPKASKPFTICSKVRSGSDSKIQIDRVPCINDKVYVYTEIKGEIKQGEIKLTEELGDGGEGTIYRTNTPYVAKIYNKECCTEYRFEKVLKLINANLKCEGICFPVAILFNQDSKKVGYLMQEAKGYSIQSSIFRKPLFLKKFPGWKKKDLVQCAITILTKIKYLHDNNILIGDINPKNFLVVNPNEVYLVDTDSFQLDDLPCPVGFPLFTAPEIHMMRREGRELFEILRTKESEYFAVATLVFMLMMPGKPPYTQQGGEDIVDNILEMHFPYAVGERHGENVPDGTWRFIWSHLTRRMKDIFLTVFNKSDDNSDYNKSKRLSVDEWLKELKEYSRILDRWGKELTANPLTKDVDPLSLELYPTRLKHQPGKEYAFCKECGREYITDMLKGGYCPECQRKGTPAKCWYCKKEFTFTNYEKFYLKLNKPPILCPDCRKTKEEIVYNKACEVPGCKNRITFTRGELAFQHLKAAEAGYEFAFPKKCKECKSNGKRIPPRERPYSSGNNKGTSSSAELTHRTSSGSKGCFITTAVCSYLGKADNCEELTSFRFFRDTWLVNQPKGRELVEEYYRIAPMIVRKMEESPEYESICQTIWNKFLIPCYQMIEDNQFEKCKNKYVDMVEYLRTLLSV